MVALDYIDIQVGRLLVSFTFYLHVSLQMANISVTYRDGRVAQLEQVYIRGSKIRFLILPDMLKNAPMLKSMKNKNQSAGAGRGKAAILKAQGKLFLLYECRCVLEEQYNVCNKF